MKTLKRDMAPLLVILITIFVWHKVLNQQFMGEGYTFFLRNTITVNGSFLIGLISRMDVFARLLFLGGGYLFKDNISIYQYFMLAVMIGINILFYRLVYVMTSKRLIALMSVVFTAANYATSYQILAMGFYQIFIGRLPNFIPALLSLILLIQGCKSYDCYRYWLSVGLFVLAMMMSHFTIYLLPAFPIITWPAYFKDKKYSLNNIVKYGRFFIPWIIVALGALWLEKKFDPETLAYGKTGWRYFVQSLSYIPTVAYQLVLISIPGKILLLFTEPTIRNEVMTLFWPVILFYTITGYIIYRQDKKLFGIALSSLMFILASLYLNSYTREELVQRMGDNSRYLYVAFFGVAIYWAIIIYIGLWQKRHFILRMAILVVMGWWIKENSQILWHKINQNQKYHDGVKISLQYLKDHFKEFPNGSIVILPHELGYYGAGFALRFYNSGDLIMEPIFAAWEENERFNTDKLLVLDYDYQAKQVVDKTVIFKQLFLNRRKLGETEFKKRLRIEKTAEMEKGNLLK